MNITRRFSVYLLGLALVTAARAAEAQKPNFVYIMADELGYYELSLMGHPYIQTPNIDRMAAEGIRFRRFLAGSSLCAPTRAVLMTGKHSGHTSVRTNGGGTPLRADEATVASVLKGAGYATGGFGKWGCGGRGSTGVPEQHGFDEFVGYYDQVHAHSYYPPYIVRNSEELVLPGNRGGRSGETYSHYVIFDAAKEFIRQNKDQPFFCYLPVTPPHGMFDLPEDDPAWKLYQDREWPQEARAYAAMVTMLDRQVGEVLKLLQELDLEENTLVFFCGDNGGNDYFKSAERKRGFHGPNVDPRTQDEFRGHKGNLYEGGLRIPMIARWPGRIEPGQVSDYLGYFPDVLPTLAELASATAPDDVDGISIVPTLLGEQAAGRPQDWHEYLYWELGPQTAVRAGTVVATAGSSSDWKAVQPKKNAAWELYDLSRDRSERHDVAAEHQEILARLQACAESAHEPAREGVFHDREIHEKDRQAKWGDTRRAADNNKVNKLPRKGLISSAGWKILRVSSESASNGKLASNAFDGDPRTIWHTRWQDELAKHPHELVIDLGASHEIRGLRYLTRQDSGWNGSIKDCEIYISDSADATEATPIPVSFTRTKKAQEASFTPVKGRFVRIKILSEVSGGAWASIAELGLIAN